MSEGRKDKLVVAALKAAVSGTALVNHTFVSKGRIKTTCQQLVLRVIRVCVCVCVCVCLCVCVFVSGTCLFIVGQQK